MIVRDVTIITETSGPGDGPTVPATPAVSDDEMRVRFPAHDFDGYWFFGGLRGGGDFRALMMGLSIGVNDGYDWGFRDVTPEPDYGLYLFRAIGPERSVGYGQQPIHRHQFEYDRRRLDVRLDDRVRVSLTGNDLRYHMQSPDGSLSLDLEGRLGGSAYWTPDMVFRGTSWVTVALPDIEFEGQLRADGEVIPLSGIATLDHPMGRNRRSEMSVGMGWWEYNCFMLNGGFGLFQWKIVDRAGDVVLNRAVTNFPDGQMHVGTMDLEYLEWEDRGTVQVPRAWRVVVHADHGVLEHEVRADGPPWDGTPHRRGDPLPNFALSLTGRLRLSDGSVLPTHGRGTGETVISERDPYRDQPQDPW